jgi:hypothetical protein
MKSFDIKFLFAAAENCMKNELQLVNEIHNNKIKSSSCFQEPFQYQSFNY